MQKDNVKFEKDYEFSIWRKLFLPDIFQTGFLQYDWIIDGPDKCLDASSLFYPMQAKLDKSILLRILITGWETSELDKSFTSLGNYRFRSERILLADTLPEVKLLVEAKAKSLIVKDGC
jgi:hypothetical protein